MTQNPQMQHADVSLSTMAEDTSSLAPQPTKGRGNGAQVKRRALTKRLREFGLAGLFLLPALAVFVIFTYFPFFRALWLSLNITNELGDPVKFIGLRYYQQILDFSNPDNDYLRSLLTSCEFVIMVVVFQILCGLGLASLALAKVRGIGVFRLIFTISIAVSLASSSVIWALIFDPTTNVTNWIVELLGVPQPGLLNNSETALIAVAAMSVWSGLGFTFVITLAGMQAIPGELYESASLDGAGAWHKFVHITLPLLTPILLFLLVVNTIQSFQAFTQFKVLMNGPGPDSSTNVFTFAIYQSFWIDHRYGFASAMSVVLFLILLILSLIQFIFLGRRVHYR